MVRRAWVVLCLAACANGQVIDDDAGFDASLSDSSSSDVGASDAGKDVIKPTEAGCPNNLTACGNACVDLKTDPAHCGGCNTGCTAPDGGTPGCDAGACTFGCN